MRVNDVTFEIVKKTGTEVPAYDLTFSIPSANAPVKVRYRKLGSFSLDSALHDPSAESVPYSYKFTSLSERDVEGRWEVTWQQSAGGSLTTDQLVIPNSAISNTTPGNGLDPVPENVEIVLSGDNSPYVSKKVRISKLILALEKFSEGSEYNPAGSYILPQSTKAISLEVNDYVPLSFEGDREDWLRYFIIINNNTYPITPRNRPGQFPIIYHLNSPLVGQVRDAREENNEGFIDIDSDGPIDLSIKIEQERPADQTSATPIVFGYKIKYINYDEA